MEAKFAWIDLSTFDVKKASAFYREVFYWKSPEKIADYNQYTLDGVPCAGIYSMPPFFRSIQMPSFWMTYISVADVTSVATKALELGGKVELEEESPLGNIALIRDPAGAGFTCYQGGARSVERSFAKDGKWCWTELMVSDISLVKDFYTALFGWRIQREVEDRFGIRTASGLKIGSIQVAEEKVKGAKEFWAVYFAVSDLQKTLGVIKTAGGRTGGIYPHEYGTQGLAYDDQGAAFFIIQNDKAATPPSSSASGNLKWRCLIGLIAIYWIVLFEQTWGWGVLFLFWVLPDLKSGTTYFIEPLSRRTNPFLYWAVVLTWMALSVYLLLDAFSAEI